VLVAPPTATRAGPPDPRDDDLALAAPGPTAERRVAPAASVAALAVLAALVLVPRLWPGASGGTRVPPEPHLGAVDRPAEALDGRLAYVAEDATGERRLWVLDLSAGTARRGPAVGDVVDLVDLSEAHDGWLGVEVTGPGGSHRALALPALDPDTEPLPIARGDRLAWGPGGRTLAAATEARTGDGCRDVAIDLVTVSTGAVQRGRPRPEVCGPLLSLGRSAVATYFSSRTADGVDTFFSGTVGIPHLLFGNTRMLSASPLGQFLVTAPAEREEVGAGELLYLAWRGRGGPLPVRLGTLPVDLERVVAWSRDGALVAFVGRVEERAALYVLRAGSGSAVREPVHVTAGEALDATFASDGSLFVVGDGSIHVWRDGRLGRLLLPGRAPAPSGPVVWQP
jgi:hypothetical protein